MVHQSPLLRFFPLPRVLEMSAVGIDISDRSLHFAELVQGEEGLTLGRYGSESIPNGIIVEGVIEKPEELKKFLAKFNRAYGFHFIRASLPEQKGYLVKMTIPQMKKSEIRGSIELQIEDHVPIAADNAIFDYQMACEKKGRTTSMDVGVAVMPKNVVESYVEAFKGSGMVPLSFELEAHAIARALLPEGHCETTMIVDIGATRTGFSIIHEGLVRYTSTINLGGELLTDAVMTNFGLSRVDALAKKEAEGLGHRDGNDDLYSLLLPIVSILQDEVKKRILYWNSRDEVGRNPSKMKIQRIILCGGEANVPGLKHYLTSTLNYPVELGNPWINITSFDHYIPELTHNRSLSYVTALGLALHRTH